MSGFYDDVLGTSKSYFQIGLPGASGPRIKATGGNIALRNSGDSADVQLTASQINLSASTGQIVLNSAAAGSGADWTYTLSRPSSGMTANQTLTFPAGNGSPNQVLQGDGSGNLSWVSAASTAACISQHSETVVFGASSPVTMFTLPANALISQIDIFVDTAFTGGSSPTLTVGVSGTTSKYVGAGDNDLTTQGRYSIHPSNIPDVSSEALIATYSAGGSTAGSARIVTSYSVPTSP